MPYLYTESVSMAACQAPQRNSRNQGRYSVGRARDSRTGSRAFGLDAWNRARSLLVKLKPGSLICLLAPLGEQRVTDNFLNEGPADAGPLTCRLGDYRDSQELPFANVASGADSCPSLPAI